MIRSNSDTTTTSTYSPTPTSPFSSNLSVPSEPTSDETPDLGAFTAVLRAWSHLQPPPRVVNASLANAQQDVPSTTTSRTLSSFSSVTHSRNLNNTHSELESDTDLRDNQSTVWAHRRIASYLNYIGDTSTHHNTDTESQTDRDRPVSVFSSETIGEPEPDLQTEHEDTDTRGLMVPIRDIDELDSSSYDNEIYDDDNDDDDENDHHHRLDKTEVIDERSSLPPSQTEQEPQYELEEENDDPNGRTPLNMETLIDFGEELGEQPSLGYLDEALKFIAAERERFTAQREAGIATTSLTNGIEPRKRRRRKRTKTPRAHSTTRTATGSTITATSKSTITGADGDVDDPDADADESSSSYDQNYSTSYSTSNYTSSSAVAIPLFKSAPGTPGASRRARGRDRRQRHPHQLPSNPHPSQIATTATSLGKQRHLKHSRSTPQLRILQRDTDEDDASSDEVIESPRVAQLRALGRKLETLFPEDLDYLKKVRYTMLNGLSPTSAGRGNYGGDMGTAYGSGTYGPHLPKTGAGPIAGKRSPGGVEGDAPGTGPGGIFGGFIDTRGPPPTGSTSDTMPHASTSTNGTGKGRQDKGRAKKKVEEDEKLIHVFVDHSNILIGLINYLKRYPQKHPQYRDLLGGITSGSGNSVSASSQYGSGINNVVIPSGYPKPPKHLSHSALTLILERGRPVTRRVLVTSSPLYQPMESATMLGFDVKVFARVPDYGDGLDRERDRERERERENVDRGGAVTRVENGNGRKKTHKRSMSSGSFSGLTRETSASASGTSGSASGSANGVSPKKGRRRAGSVNNGLNMNNSNTNIASGGVLGRRKSHKRQASGSNSTESEQGAGNAATRGFPQAFVRSLSGPASGITGGNSPSNNSNAVAATIPSVPTPQRIRYREQGVDELLQLKLHQVLAALDGPPPPGSTIILVTGDGNAGQYNEEGFLGGVRTALKKGWKVELYAWEGGLSRAWNREFGEGSELGSGFRVIGLEQFGTELVEIYY